MFHRDHIVRFIAVFNVKTEEGEKIKERAETAIAEFSNSEEGHFSGVNLEEVLGTPELVRAFDDMWEKRLLDA